MAEPSFSRAFWQALYSWFLLPLGMAGLWLAARLNPKLRRGIRERSGLWARLETQASARDVSRPLVWFHVASAGELLQALPVLERLLTAGAQCALTVTSPSGHGWAVQSRERLKESGLIAADYLPLDTRRNARRILEILRPSALVYLKYDLWPNLVWEAGSRGVPQFLVSATLGERSWRFSSRAGRAMYRTLYAALTGIFPVGEADADRYRRTHPGHRCIEVLGDTRFDGVLERRKSLDTVRLNNMRLNAMQSNTMQSNTMQLPVFPDKAVVFVGGSIWPPDVDCILPVLIEALGRYPALVLVLAPHEIEEGHLRTLEARLGDIPPARLTGLAPGGRLESRVLLVDTMGHLAALYSRAALAYVGGGFSGNIHNVLEPAAEGVPVLFGPRHGKDPQAGALIAAGGARSIAGSEAFREALHALLDDPGRLRETGAAAAQFVESRAGAAARSCERIQAVLA